MREPRNMEEKMEAFLLLLSDIVNAGSPFEEKKAKLVALCNEGDRVNLDEFVSWFEEGDL